MRFKMGILDVLVAFTIIFRYDIIRTDIFFILQTLADEFRTDGMSVQAVKKPCETP